MCESIGRRQQQNIGFTLLQSVSIDATTNVCADFTPKVTKSKTYTFPIPYSKKPTKGLQPHTTTIDSHNKSTENITYNHHTHQTTNKPPIINHHQPAKCTEDEPVPIPIPISWVGKPDLAYPRRQSTSSIASATSTNSNTSSFAFDHQQLLIQNAYGHVLYDSNDDAESEIDIDSHHDPTHHHQQQQQQQQPQQIQQEKEITESIFIPLRPLSAELSCNQIDDVPMIGPIKINGLTVPICEDITNPKESYDSASESDNHSEDDDENLSTPHPASFHPNQPTQTIDDDEDDEDVNDSNEVKVEQEIECKVLNLSQDHIEKNSHNTLPNLLEISPLSLDDIDLPPLPSTPDTLHASLCNNCKPIQEDEDGNKTLDSEEDEKCGDLEIDDEESKEIEEVLNYECYEQLCTDKLLPYDWLTAIKNESHYSAYFRNFQTEVMGNPFYKLTAGEFNDLLKKCQFICSRWLGKQIRSTRAGNMGKYKWKIGEKISELDLFAIKLYTDFEVCQRELKLCYRPPTNGDQLEILNYEKRLCHFRHWRRVLNTAILKYGKLLRNRVFYHGINKLMKLNIHPTSRCEGPFSCSTDVDIARGFATRHGFILKMCSKYPRLGTDYCFDAAPISAFPDEKELLIGFLYTRILEVQLGCINLTINDLMNTSMVTRLTCFILSSLIENNLYSYGRYLEVFFKALLITDSAYNDDSEIESLFKEIDSTKRKEEIEKVRKIADLIPNIIKDQFIKCRQERKVLKLDTISDGMEPLFYDNGGLSLSKISKYTPNISQLHLYEEYSIDNHFISNFISFLQSQKSQNIEIELNTIKLFKYSFDGSSDQYQFKRSISKTNLYELSNLGWYIYEQHELNSYKFTLTTKQRRSRRRN